MYTWGINSAFDLETVSRKGGCRKAGNHNEHKEELFFFFAVKENCHGGKETRRREKKLFLRDSVAKAFMTQGDKPSS